MTVPGFTLRGFRSPREVVGAVLGKLERQVMEEVWRRKEVSVRDVHAAFDQRMAYTTLMTTLDRLHKKGLLSRWKNGRAFIYSARVSPSQFKQSVASDVISGLLGRNSGEVEPVLACIVDAVSENDRTLLDELERLVKEKRRELKRLE
jgi:predicted transcriptional regulator